MLPKLSKQRRSLESGSLGGSGGRKSEEAKAAAQQKADQIMDELVKEEEAVKRAEAKKKAKRRKKKSRSKRQSPTHPSPDQDHAHDHSSAPSSDEQDTQPHPKPRHLQPVHVDLSSQAPPKPTPPQPPLKPQVWARVTSQGGDGGKGGKEEAKVQAEVEEESWELVGRGKERKNGMNDTGSVGGQSGSAWGLGAGAGGTGVAAIPAPTANVGVAGSSISGVQQTQGQQQHTAKKVNQQSQLQQQQQQSQSSSMFPPQPPVSSPKRGWNKVPHVPPPAPPLPPPQVTSDKDKGLVAQRAGRGNPWAVQQRQEGWQHTPVMGVPSSSSKHAQQSQPPSENATQQQQHACSAGSTKRGGQQPASKDSGSTSGVAAWGLPPQQPPPPRHAWPTPWAATPPPQPTPLSQPLPTQAWQQKRQGARRPPPPQPLGQKVISFRGATQPDRTAPQSGGLNLAASQQLPIRPPWPPISRPPSAEESSQTAGPPAPPSTSSSSVLGLSSSLGAPLKLGGAGGELGLAESLVASPKTLLSSSPAPMVGLSTGLEGSSAAMATVDSPSMLLKDTNGGPKGATLFSSSPMVNGSHVDGGLWVSSAGVGGVGWGGLCANAGKVSQSVMKIDWSVDTQHAGGEGEIANGSQEEVDKDFAEITKLLQAVHRKKESSWGDGFASLDKSFEQRSGPLVCAMTGQKMMDPVTAADGHTYERAAIEGWLAGNNTSPVTGNVLANRALVSNLVAREVDTG